MGQGRFLLVGEIGLISIDSSWSDFYVDQLNDFITQYPGVEGIYIDNACVNMSSNTFLGHDQEGGQQVNGKYQTFATRELQKRIYKIIKAGNPDAMIIAHCAGMVSTPVMSFYDGYVDGERYYTVKDYMDETAPVNSTGETITFEEFRAEFIGTKWGVTPILLGRLGDYTSDPKYTEEMIGYARVHGVNLYVASSSAHMDTVEALWAIEDDFGMTGVDFLPYWSNDNIVTIQSGNENIKISLFAHTDGSSLIYVTNFENALTTETVYLDLTELGYSGSNILTDAHMGSSVPLVGGDHFTVDIEGWNYRLLWLH